MKIKFYKPSIMFNSKNTTVLKCVVLALLAFTACSKNDNDNNGPDINNEANDYLVQGIYWDNSAQDSFVYVNNQLTEAWFKEEKETAYMEKSEYTYNADGFLAKSKNYSKRNNTGLMVLYSVDSLAWGGSSFVNYNTSYYEGAASYRDTVKASFDASKRLTQVGTKDTVRSEYSKQLSYVEFQLSGANIIKRAEKYYYLSSSPDAVAQDIVETTTIEYGDLLNPLQAVLIKNPVLAMDLENASDVVFLSYNSPNKISYVGKDESEVATVKNEALQGTKVLSKSTYSFDGGTLTMSYSLKKK